MLLIKVASISIYFLKIHHYVGYFVNELPNFSKYLFTFSITNYKREKQTLIMLMFISNNILSTVWKYLAWKQGKYFITCISSWDSRSSTRHFPWEKKERKYFRKAPPPTGSKQKHALYFSSTLSSWEKNRQTIRDYKLLFYILNIAEQKNKIVGKCCTPDQAIDCTAGSELRQVISRARQLSRQRVAGPLNGC